MMTELHLMYIQLIHWLQWLWIFIPFNLWYYVTIAVCKMSVYAYSVDLIICAYTRTTHEDYITQRK